MHSLRQLERLVQLTDLPLPQVWLLTMSHSKIINKSLHIQSFPTWINRTHAQSHMHKHAHTHTHGHSHTTYLSLTAAKGTLVPSLWRAHSPSHFISDGQIPWADYGVLNIPPFLACAGQVYSSENNMQCLHCRIIIQLGHWCSSPPAPN